MSAETDFQALLVGYAPLVALVGRGISQNAVDPSVSPNPPVIVYTSAHDRTHALDGSLVADEVTFTVQCWASNSVQADLVADAAEAAIATAPASAYAEIGSRSAEFNPEIGLDGVVFTVLWN